MPTMAMGSGARVAEVGCSAWGDMVPRVERKGAGVALGRDHDPCAPARAAGVTAERALNRHLVALSGLETATFGCEQISRVDRDESDNRRT
jgi:hypothetical protein